MTKGVGNAKAGSYSTARTVARAKAVRSYMKKSGKTSMNSGNLKITYERGTGKTKAGQSYHSVTANATTRKKKP